MFSIFLGLIGPPPLPIKLVSDLNNARIIADPIVKKSMGKPNIKALLTRMIISTIRYHRFKSITILIINILLLFYSSFPILSILIFNIFTILLIYYKQKYLIKKWTNNYSSNQYKYYSQLKNESTYKNNKLIEKCYNNIELSSYYKDLIINQPMSGYCGYATLNTILTSISKQKYNNSLYNGLLQFNTPNYISVDIMCKLLNKLNSKEYSLWNKLGIKNFTDLSGIQYEEYIKIIKTQLNNPKYRFMACWHRSPLFFCCDTMKQRINTEVMVHWSPLAGYLEEENLILLIDVNEAYGPFLVSPERLFDTIDIKDFVNGKPLGLVRIEITQ